MSQKLGVHSFLTSKRHFTASGARSQAGFSLVELLVVISITAFLLSIGVAVAVRMLAEARRTQVRAVLDGLKGANEQFKVVRGNKVNVDITVTAPVDWTRVGINASELSSSEMLVYALQLDSKTDNLMQSALRGGGESAYKREYKDDDGDGFFEIYDRWGTEIEYRPFNTGNGTSPGGTDVDNDKLPITRSALLVSAGPDEEFGTVDDISTENQPVYADN